MCVGSLPYALRDLNSPVVRTSTKECPTTSTPPSRPSFNTTEDMIEEAMEADGKDYKTARRKVRISISCTFSSPTLILDQALARDGFRCILTGMFDDVSLLANRGLAREAEASHNSMMSTVTTCYIVNESTMQDVDPSGDSGSVVNKVWAIGLLDPFHNLPCCPDRLCRCSWHSWMPWAQGHCPRSPRAKRRSRSWKFDLVMVRVT